MGLFLFDTVKQMAFQSGVVILLVLCCRGVMHRAPRRFSYALWAIVALRLMCPIMLPAEFSLFQFVSLQPLSQLQSFMGQQEENATVLSRTTDISVSDAADDGVGSQKTEDNPTYVGQTSQTSARANSQKDTFFYIWAVGVAVMLAYGFASHLLFRQRLKYATRAETDVYESDRIAAPFVYGILMPRIYIPYHLGGTERAYILAHERYHIRRRDYLVKLLAFFLLCVYWFHPLVWISYYLMNRDMEISCDERVMAGKSAAEKEAYAALLLAFASGKTEKLFVPACFGENSTKQRVRHILYDKKPLLRGNILAACLLVFAAMVCLTDAKETASVQAGTAVSETAKLLYESRNPYVGDASANAVLMKIIDQACGMEFGRKFFLTTELQTSSEPYAYIMHLNPVSEDAVLSLTEEEEYHLWKRAVLFLALTDNCDIVEWDYETETDRIINYVTADKTGLSGAEGYVKSEYLTSADFSNLQVQEASTLSDGWERVELTAADIKEYGASAETVNQLLNLLELQTPGVKWQTLAVKLCAKNDTQPSILLAEKGKDE